MDNSVKIFDSEKTLHVLQEIERNPQITQRVLAQKLEISLGKINFLINALMDKGIIEIKNFKNSKNKLAYTYLLTPQGIKIKFELTRKFFIWKTQEYERLKLEIESLKNEANSALPQEGVCSAMNPALPDPSTSLGMVRGNGERPSATLEDSPERTK